MVKVIAIGGGGIKQALFTTKTLALDREIVRLSGKINPSVLFVPTANKDDPLYSQSFYEYYTKNLGCNVRTLNLTSGPSHAVIEGALLKSDIIYVGGGNTSLMIKTWRKSGFDRLLLNMRQSNKVLAGVSAGAICWFEAGISDSRRYTHRSRKWQYINVHGLNAIKGLMFHRLILCPHYDSEPRRHTALKRSLLHYDKIGIALEECVALEINDSKYRIIVSDKSKKAYKAFWGDGVFHLVPLEISETWQPVENLFTKDV